MRQLLVLAVTAALVFCASVQGSAGHIGAVPPKLVGKWSRTISKADVTRANGSFLAIGKHASLTVASNGHWTGVIAGLGNLGKFAGTVTSAGTNQVRFGVSGTPPGLYRWRVSGSTLTLTKIRDDQTGRLTELSGAWKHA